MKIPKPEPVNFHINPERKIELFGGAYGMPIPAHAINVEEEKQAIKMMMATKLAQYLADNMTYSFDDLGSYYQFNITIGIYPLTDEEKAEQNKYLTEYITAIKEEQEKIVDALIKARGE